jgi:hypothetical protein
VVFFFFFVDFAGQADYCFQVQNCVPTGGCVENFVEYKDFELLFLGRCISRYMCKDQIVHMGLQLV